MKFKLIEDIDIKIHFGYDFGKGPQDVKEPEFIRKLEGHPHFEKVAAGRPKKPKVKKNADNSAASKKSAQEAEHSGPVRESDEPGE